MNMAMTALPGLPSIEHHCPQPEDLTEGFITWAKSETVDSPFCPIKIGRSNSAGPARVHLGPFVGELEREPIPNCYVVSVYSD